MLTILIYFLVFILIVLVSTILVNATSYKTYKEFYKKLPTLQFYNNGNVQVYDSNSRFPNFVWFVKKHHFMFYQNVNLSNGLIFNLDPIHHYWLKKYRKWFDKHIVISELPKFNINN